MIRFGLTTLMLTFFSLLVAGGFSYAETPSPPAASPAAASANSSAAGGAPSTSVTLPIAAAPVKEPAPIKNKTITFSIRTQTNACVNPAPTCTIDTFLVARANDNDDLIWERRLYYRPYDSNAELAKQVIEVKSLKFMGPKMIQVKNAKGDVFSVEAVHGHMKKPKEPKSYAK